MGITLFKSMATMSHDNRPSAAKAISQSWGNAYWRDCWMYREYTLGNLVYRTGQVIRRHGHKSRVEFLVDGKEVSQYKFLKAFHKGLDDGTLKRVSSIPEPPAVSKNPKTLEPSLF